MKALCQQTTFDRFAQQSGQSENMRLQVYKTTTKHCIQCQLHEDHYRLQYYEALDRTIAGIKNRFNQPGYIMYKSVENLLLNAANCNASFEEHFMQVMDLYKYDFDSYLLLAQLQVFSTAIKTETIGTVTLHLSFTS